MWLAAGGSTVSTMDARAHLPRPEVTSAAPLLVGRVRVEEA